MKRNLGHNEVLSNQLFQNVKGVMIEQFAFTLSSTYICKLPRSWEATRKLTGLPALSLEILIFQVGAFTSCVRGLQMVTFEPNIVPANIATS